MEKTILNAYRQLSLLKTLREGTQEDEGDEGEGQFGLVPPSTDPNSALANTVNNKNSSDLIQEGPRAHPLLSKSAQFSGQDRRVTAEPQENENAQKNYPQLKLQQQLRNQKRQTPSPPPRLSR